MNTTKKILAAVTSLIIVFLVVGWFVYGRYNGSLEPLTAESNEKLVDITLGSTTSSIGDQLQNESVIASSSAFSRYVQVNSLGDKLQSGVYALNSNMPISEIADIIASGNVAKKTVTIVPGSSVSDIKKVFVKEGYSQEEVDQAFEIYSPKNYVDGVNTDNLEGYLSPNTYTLAVNAEVGDFLEYALRNFNQQIGPELRTAIASQGLSINGATILASIVQQESSLPENQKKMSQVFLKRLDEGIKLGSDPTFRYAAEIAGEPATVDIDSPYNTRINAGLPPTAIGNFNHSALEAVAYPADTDYLFFVSGDDGITYFSKTLAEHEALAAKHCIELCKL